MTDTWDRTFFDKDLKAILETKLPVSASKITSLQGLATAHPKHHNYIIQCITRFIETSPPDYRLAGLYVIDAISRAVHKQQRKREENNEGPTEADGYLKRFAIVLKDDSLIGCFEQCSTKDKEKVKKTLDFWEQGSVYSKEVVQYVKKSFLDSAALMKEKQVEEKVKASPVDTAALLATLSNIGNGSLANLNIPGLTVPAIASQNTVSAHIPAAQPAQPDILPPALAKLLGGLVSTPSPSPLVSSPPPTSSDPRTRNDPRQKNANSNWPIPQGPSIPLPNNSNRIITERKSRWGDADESVNNNTNNNYNQSYHQQQQPQVQIQDPWLQRQSIQDPRINNNYNQAPPLNNVKSYQHHQQQQQLTYQPYQQQVYNQPPPPPQRAQCAEPMHDQSLPAGCIKVLTRTLFVGPIPDHYEKEDVANLFSQYGELASVIVSKKLKGRHNAFLKFTTRASTEAAKYNSTNLVVEGALQKVNWAFGFGPKKHFDYDRGDSIIPLAELSDEEKDNLMTAPVGGFQGQPVREMMVVEEPEAYFRPEWKTRDDKHQRGAPKRQHGPSGANFEEINVNKKRGRYGNNMNNDNNYPILSPPHQPQQRYNQGPSMRGQYQQHYDPSISVNQHGDYQQ